MVATLVDITKRHCYKQKIPDITENVEELNSILKGTKDTTEEIDLTSDFIKTDMRYNQIEMVLHLKQKPIHRPIHRNSNKTPHTPNNKFSQNQTQKKRNEFAM